MIDVRWLISAKQTLLFLTGFVNVQNYFCKSTKSFVCVQNCKSTKSFVCVQNCKSTKSFVRVQNPFVQKAPLRSTGTDFCQANTAFSYRFCKRTKLFL